VTPEQALHASTIATMPTHRIALKDMKKP